MLVVHHLGLSQSERIVWLCEELELEYELKRYDRRADNRLAPDKYKSLHPMGVAPVITVDDFVLGESGAICEFINSRFGSGRLAPAPSDPDYPEHLFWFHWSNATYMATKMMGMVLGLGGSDPGRVPFVAARADRSSEMMEQRLGTVPFFGGQHLTLADIMMVYTLTTSRAFGGAPLTGMPNVQAYLRRIAERAAYQRAMAKAEPGMTPMID
ncbi:glutathione S-transferase family protein [Sphingomonas radiodurans]|uniref:glutathione S-transferase family protein n=1 Tax=Sphingomonas radiodurans TaxID=2890321 RepID=UPI001E2CE2B2|nr:glutathione S-transferase family protein [Sphingomonas radiodurans]WBH15342.1 glutathione S-transferase family protein [Sphingomonas radiodurans]